MPQKEQPAKSWIGRVWRLTRERFPVYPNAVLLYFQFAITFVLLHRFFATPTPGEAGDFRWVEFAFGGIASVLFVYLLRVFDELKDYSTDVIDFPDRPLAAGLINHRDVHTLWIVTTILLVLLQIPFANHPYVLGAFGIVMVYSFLAFKWFFAESFIRPSLPAALITHNPILYLYHLYTLSFFVPELNAAGENNLSWALMFLAGDAMAGTAWELSRKIRGTTEEDTYTTYSKIWGTTVASLMPLIFICGSFALTFYATYKATGSERVIYYWIVPALAALGYLAIAISFLRDNQKGRPFRPWVEYFKLSLFVSYILLAVFG